MKAGNRYIAFLMLLVLVGATYYRVEHGLSHWLSLEEEQHLHLPAAMHSSSVGETSSCDLCQYCFTETALWAAFTLPEETILPFVQEKKQPKTSLYSLQKETSLPRAPPV